MLMALSEFIIMFSKTLPSWFFVYFCSLWCYYKFEIHVTDSNLQVTTMYWFYLWWEMKERGVNSIGFLCSACLCYNHAMCVFAMITLSVHALLILDGNRKFATHVTYFPTFIRSQYQENWSVCIMFAINYVGKQLLILGDVWLMHSVMYWMPFNIAYCIKTLSPSLHADDLWSSVMALQLAKFWRLFETRWKGRDKWKTVWEWPVSLSPIRLDASAFLGG